MRYVGYVPVRGCCSFLSWVYWYVDDGYEVYERVFGFQFVYPRKDEK